MENQNRGLYGLGPAEITAALGLARPLQGRQIWLHLAKGVSDFGAMTDLPLAVRTSLAEKGARAFSSTVAATREDPGTGAVKLGVRLADGKIVECVLLEASGVLTACLSSQVGCAMGCRFCRTATMRLVRNLRSHEIIEQLMLLQALKGPVSHIVFMGMGEPLANIAEVLKAIEYFHNPDGVGLGHRRMTISTCGFVPGIRALAQAGVPVKLAVSLVAADEDKRRTLMPVSRTFPLGMLKGALADYQKVYRRRITLECCLMAGVNTFPEDAARLAAFCRGLDALVNLIPFNEAPELPFQTPSQEELRSFADALDSLGVPYTCRFSRGRAVSGACGQLAVSLGKGEDGRRG